MEVGAMQTKFARDRRLIAGAMDQEAFDLPPLERQRAFA